MNSKINILTKITSIILHGVFLGAGFYLLLQDNLNTYQIILGMGGVFTLSILFQEKILHIEDTAVKGIARAVYKINTFLIRKYKDYEDISSLLPKLPRQELPIEQGSALKITNTGNEMLKESGGEDYIKENIDTLTKEIGNYKNNYLLQEKCLSVIDKKQNDFIEKYGDKLFESGYKAHQIIDVMGYKLRDTIIEQNEKKNK